MATTRRGLPAKQLVREYGMTLNQFSDQVDALVTQLSDAEASMPVKRRHREVCTAIWAAITAAFDSSSLSVEQREKLNPLLQEVLVPYWEKNCASDPGMAELLAKGAEHYLKGRDPKSQVATAGIIVQRLLDAIGTSEGAKARLSRSLIPLFAHRMLGDIHHIDDVKSRFGIQLPLIAALCAATEILASYGPALKLFRLS